MKLQNIFISMLLVACSVACTDSEENIEVVGTYAPTIAGRIDVDYGTQTLYADMTGMPKYMDVIIDVYMGKKEDKKSMELYDSYELYESYYSSELICTLTDDKDLKGTYYYYLKCRLKDVDYEFESKVDKFTIKVQLSGDAEISTEEVVDLGLSVKWRGYNLGATYPQEYGDTYGWGATATTDYYSGDNPPVNISGTEYDIARTTLGGTWRIPTKEQYNELVDNCLWVAAQYRSIYGYKVVGPSGNAIFLPALKSSSYHYFEYWTGSLDITTNYAYCANDYGYGSMSGVSYKLITSSRSTDCAIRPVCD